MWLQALCVNDRFGFGMETLATSQSCHYDFLPVWLGVVQGHYTINMLPFMNETIKP